MPEKLDSKKIKKAQEAEKIEQDKYKIELSEEKQAELVERVCYLVEKDEADRKGYLDTRAKARRMYDGERDAKTDPWPNCANVSTQIVNMVVEILHSRLYPSAWNEEMIYWRPMEKNDIENVENVSRFMAWAVKQAKLKSVVDDFTHNLILDGTAVMKVRWVSEWRWVQRKIPIPDSIKDKMRNVVLRFIGGKKDFKVPEKKFQIEYDYKKFENCVVENIDLEDVGFPTYSVPSAKEDDLEYIWHRCHTTLNELKELEALNIYENVDNISESKETEVVIGTTKSSIDAENTKITQNKLNASVDIIEFYDKYDYNDDGVREDIIVTVEKSTKTLLSCKSLLSISRVNERPFVIGPLIRRSNRIYGKGMAEIAMPLEEEVNAIHNQRLDASTMSIIPFGVYRSGSGFKPENIELKPGLWIPVDDINDAKWVTVPNNVMVSFQEERMLMELVEKLTSIGSYQSGQESDINRSRATARGTMAIIQQGEIRFGILAQRVQSPLGRMLTKMLHQYQDKLPPGMSERILGEDGKELFPDGVSPEDLMGNFDAYMSIDYTGGSKASDQQAKAFLYQNLIMNPFVARNPSGLWELTAAVLKAANVENIEEIIGVKPVQNQMSQNVQDENYLMLQGTQVDTHETDNVMEHLMGHYAFRDSAAFFAMTPEYRVRFDDHVAKHQDQLASAVFSMGKDILNPDQQNSESIVPQQMLNQGQQQLPQPGMEQTMEAMSGNPAGAGMANEANPGMGVAQQPPQGGMPGFMQ